MAIIASGTRAEIERVLSLQNAGGGVSQRGISSGISESVCRNSRGGRPAMFTGSMFGALESIREVFGPLRLDAIGTCGKWGQQVPSSGGSHYFLVLDPHPDVRLGGR